MRVIAGIYRHRILKEVSNEYTRPSTDKNKEMIFNMLGQFFDSGVCLDLFGGTGALGIEALSRGMSSAYFSEINDETYKVLMSNIKSLNIENATVHHGDYRGFLKKYSNVKFDLVLLDPPYRIFNEVKDILKFMLKNKMFKKDCKLILEMPKEIEYIPDGFEYIKNKTGAASRFVYCIYRGEDIWK